MSDLSMEADFVPELTWDKKLIQYKFLGMGFLGKSDSWDSFPHGPFLLSSPYSDSRTRNPLRHSLELSPASTQEPAGTLVLHCPDPKQGCGLDCKLGDRGQGHGLRKKQTFCL